MAHTRNHIPAYAKLIGRAAVTATLCVLLVDQPVLAEAAMPPASPAVTSPLSANDRALHALNRLTFGPRPGDLPAVNAMGLKRWFERQLNPGSIDDSALEIRLQQYPAMTLSIADMQRKFPGPQILKQMETGKLPLPSDPAERAMVEDQIAFYNMQKSRQEKASAPIAGVLMPDGTIAPPEPMIPAAELAAEPQMQGLTSDFQRIPPAQIQRILSQPPDQRMQSILAMKPADLVRFRGSLGRAQVGRLAEGMTPTQKQTLTALTGSLRMIALESMESRLDRDIYSDRQLEAVMTDFWLNHFNVYVRKNQNEPYLLASYERDTIRPRALGKFEDLLVATAESPAMLEYLDNFRSMGADSRAASRIKRLQQINPNGKIASQLSAGLNENYGRELMELHTLGVNGGYTQADVTAVSKVFTGWTLDRPYQGGGFQFQENRHEPGSKVVLGRTIHENGMQEGLEVLHMLATSPATAHFISEKLAVRFVSDIPPATLVDKMSASFLQSGGDIKSVLRTMFNAPEFWSPAVYRAKVKTPLEFVVSAVRAGNLQVSNPQALVQSLDKLGMPLYGMQTPNGYSWKQDEWVSTGALVSRMNFSLVLSGDRMPGLRTEWTQLLGEAIPQAGGLTPAAYPAPESAGKKERRLELVLLGSPVSVRTRSTVLSQSGDNNATEQAATEFDLRGNQGKGNIAGRGLGRAGNQLQGPPDDPQAAVMAGLLLGSPEFQRR